MLKRFAPALGRLEQPPRNYAAQRYAPDLRPALSEFDCGRVGVLTPGFDDLPDEIAGNEERCQTSVQLLVGVICCL
jgi:hypothetical protein